MIGLRIGLDLGDDRLVDRVGHLRAHARDLVADVGGRGVRVALQREANVDAALLGAALRGHHLDALDARQRVLEDLRDLRLDHFGRRAAVGRVDADDRLVDARILAHRQPRVGDEPDQQDDQRQHRREDRPLDADFGQLHRRLLAAVRTWAPRSSRLGLGRRRHRSAIPDAADRGAASPRTPARRSAAATLHRHAVAQLQLSGGDDDVVGIDAAARSRPCRRGAGRSRSCRASPCRRRP